MGVPFIEISAAGAGALTLAPGAALALEPGRELAARVLASGPDGRVELSVAGGRLSARSDVPLEAGQTLALVAEGSRDDAVVLRLVSVGAGLAGSAVTEEAPLPASVARVLAAAAAEAEGSTAAPAAATQAPAAARAAEAGVRTPAQAAAFARLDAAGLPTTEAAVRGLAALVEDAPLGRALAAILAAVGEGEGGESAIWRQGVAQVARPGRRPIGNRGRCGWHRRRNGQVATASPPTGTDPDTAKWQPRSLPKWHATPGAPTGTTRRRQWHEPRDGQSASSADAEWQRNRTRQLAHAVGAKWHSPVRGPPRGPRLTLAKLVAKVADQAASGDPMDSAGR